MAIGLNLDRTLSNNPTNPDVLTAQSTNLTAIATNNAEVQQFSLGAYSVPFYRLRLGSLEFIQIILKRLTLTVTLTLV
jgi:hypothetical protein